MMTMLRPTFRLTKLHCLAPASSLKADSVSPWNCGSSNSNCSRSSLPRSFCTVGFTNNNPIRWRLDAVSNSSLISIGRRTFVQVSPTEFYDILGLTPKATSEDVKATYFKLSKIYHPDVCKDPGGVEKFVLISKAYETLGNEEKRREYDRGILNPIDERSGHAASRPSREFTQEDILRYQEIFNQHHDIPKAKRAQFVQKGKRKGVYDFDEYYKQHYQDEMKKQTTSMQANSDLRAEKRIAKERQRQEEQEEAEKPPIRGFLSWGPYLVLFIIILVMRKYGIFT